MVKEDLHNDIYIHNGILAIKKNETMPFATAWMDLEIIILSEAGQMVKDKHNIAYMWKLKKWYKGIYKTEIDPKTQKTNLCLPKGKGEEE